MKNARDSFLDMINFDRSKNEVNYEGFSIKLKFNDESKDPSYLDRRHYESTGEWLIHLYKSKRPIKELLFDFYHQVGHILYQHNIITDNRAKRWIEAHQEFKYQIEQAIFEEMTCDAFAISKCNYTGNVVKYVPFTKLDYLRNKYPEYSSEDIATRIRVINNQKNVRRKYLERIMGDNVPIVDTDFREKGNPEWIELGKNKGQKSSVNAYQIMAELKEEAKLERKSEMLNSMAWIADKVKVCYNTKDGFEAISKKIKAAMLDPIVESRFNIDPHEYHNVINKPTDWEENYTKYWMYDKSSKMYIKIPKSKDSSVPEFNGNVFTKERINTRRTIYELRTRYKRVTEEFLVPMLQQYQKEISVEKRNAIAYCVRQLYYTPTGDVPTKGDIEKFMSYNGQTYDELIRHNSRNTALMLTHKEKTERCKNNNPKFIDESDKDYEARIYNLVVNNQWI